MNKLLLLILFIVNIAYANDEFAIKSVYLSAQGNNKIESKILAHREGRHRAFMLLADKLGVYNSGLQNIPHSELETAVLKVSYEEEHVTDRQYSALVNLYFDPDITDKLIYKYSDQKTRERFNEFLIIPMLKQGKNISIWDNNWYQAWEKNADRLANSHLILLDDKIDNKNRITIDNIQELKYENTLFAIREYFTRKSVVISAEYYTSLSDGKSYLEVTYRYILPDKIRTLVQNYPLSPNQPAEKTFKDIIDKFIKEHGKVRNNKNAAIVKSSVASPMLNKPSDNLDNNYLILSVEVFHRGDSWQPIKNKLHKMKEIKNYQVLEGSGNLQQIKLYYKSSIENLVKDMIDNGLSYTESGTQKLLFETRDGI